MIDICMVHPDILKMEREGYLKKAHIIGLCDVCKKSIQKGETYYDMGDCLVCENCEYDYMRRFRKSSV